jgi:hypothetical protein
MLGARLGYTDILPHRRVFLNKGDQIEGEEISGAAWFGGGW